MAETPTLTYDIDSLRGGVTEFICSAYSKLKSASETISSLPTPKGCESARNLSEIVDNIKNSVGAVKTAIENAADALENNEYSIIDLIWDKLREFFNLPPDIDIDVDANVDEEKLKDPLSENTPFESSKKDDVAKSLAKKYHIDTRGKTADEIIREAKEIERSRKVKLWDEEFSGVSAGKYGMETTKDTETNLKPKNNRDIAHRGYTPGDIYDNSAEGFKLAGEKGFWGCETDIRFDASGNLVCSHNSVKNGENPTSFEEYLDICKEYGMTAIIDLKYEKGVGPADANLSPEILKVIQEKGMMDSCVLQTNNYTDIPYIRETSEDARIWYLTDVISEDNINLMKENNVECVNTTSSKNNAYKIKKITENGIDVCVWNVQTDSAKERVKNMGATYVMSDNVLGITPYQEGEEDVNGLE